MLWLQRFLAATGLAVALGAAEKPPDVVTVCEAIHDPQSYDHKVVFLLGRISKRSFSGNNERSIGEDSCDGSAPAQIPKLRIQFSESGPKPPDQLALDVTEAKRKFARIEMLTTIHAFRFGSGEYEEWGIVFGRLELGHSEAAEGSVVCRGQALIFPWAGR